MSSLDVEYTDEAFESDRLRGKREIRYEERCEGREVSVSMVVRYTWVHVSRVITVLEKSTGPDGTSESRIA